MGWTNVRAQGWPHARHILARSPSGSEDRNDPLNVALRKGAVDVPRVRRKGSVDTGEQVDENAQEGGKKHEAGGGKGAKQGDNNDNDNNNNNNNVKEGKDGKKGNAQGSVADRRKHDDDHDDDHDDNTDDAEGHPADVPLLQGKVKDDKDTVDEIKRNMKWAQEYKDGLGPGSIGNEHDIDAEDSPGEVPAKEKHIEDFAPAKANPEKDSVDKPLLEDPTRNEQVLQRIIDGVNDNEEIKKLNDDDQGANKAKVHGPAAGKLSERPAKEKQSANHPVDEDPDTGLPGFAGTSGMENEFGKGENGIKEQMDLENHPDVASSEDITTYNEERRERFKDNFFSYIPIVAGALESIFFVCSLQHPHSAFLDATSGRKDDVLRSLTSSASSYDNTKPLTIEEMAALTSVRNDCTMLIVSKIIGLTIVVIGSLLKLPILMTVLRQNSVRGLPMRPFFFETYALIISFIWNIQNDTPKTTWGEVPLLLLANLIIVYIHFRPIRTPRKMLALGAILLGTLICYMNRELTSHFLMPTTLPAVLFGFLIQIVMVYRMKHIGTISPITYILGFYTSLGRVLTTFIEISDVVVRTGSILGFVLSLVGVFQMVYYRRNTAVFLRGLRKQNGESSSPTKGENKKLLGLNKDRDGQHTLSAGGRHRRQTSDPKIVSYGGEGSLQSQRNSGLYSDLKRLSITESGLMDDTYGFNATNLNRRDSPVQAAEMGLSIKYPENGVERPNSGHMRTRSQTKAMRRSISNLDGTLRELNATAEGNTISDQGTFRGEPSSVQQRVANKIYSSTDSL